MTLANVPYYTNRGTFVQNGSDYSLSNQLRVRPGVYTRQKENGELEAHINVLPGKGMAHRIFLDPEKGVFKLNVGQANLPLLPLLKAMGVQDRQLHEAWGRELASVNMQADDPTVIKKLYAKLFGEGRGTANDHESMRQAVARKFMEMEVDPDVTRQTLKQSLSKVDPQLLLATTQKLLRVSKGEEEPDDRDNLAYQSVMGPEDIMAERIRKDKHALRSALWKASSRRNLGGMQTGILDKALKAAIYSSGLGQPVESINPLQIYEQQGRVTRMGEGAIQSMDAVPMESRSVQPSHFGFIDLVVTPESEKAGVDSRIATKTKKGSDGRLYARFLDKTGQETWKSTQDLTDKVIGMPGADPNDMVVPALRNGKFDFVNPAEIDYQLPHMEEAFSPLSNLVPFKSAMKPQRAVMAGRFLSQSLPVVNAEAPFVQSGIPGTDKSYEGEYSKHMGAIRSKGLGIVQAVDADEVAIKDPYTGKVETYDLANHFPYNRKTMLHNTALVKPGDVVQPDQLIARSNYTDAEGTAAMGLNARVAFTSFRGENFEDAVSVSESFAKRATSEHLYQHPLEMPEGAKIGKKAFTGLFASKYDKETLAKLDDDGIIKVGQSVNYGEPLVVMAREKEKLKNQIHSARDRSFSDASEVWDHHTPGIVTDVEKTKKGVNVVVKTLMPMQAADKISGRFGNKGVLAKIVSDSEMPTDADGKPFEVLMPPHVVTTRVNPGQILETLLGKIAEKTGKPYKIADFDKISDLTEFVTQELQKHGMKDRDDIVDPTNGRTIPNVLTGNMFVMKLHHTAASKDQGRGIGSYTSEGLPSKSGDQKSKRLSLMDVNALLSHGALDVIRDAKLVRGQGHPEYWQQFMLGKNPPPPKVPLVYQKFVDQMRGSGVNVVRDGAKFNIMAMKNSDVDQLAGDREIQHGGTVDWKGELKPIAGGLFDEKLTGGHNARGTWAKISLPEPMPNPVMIEPIRKVLDMTEKEFEAVLSGRAKYKDRTGPQAIQKALEEIDIDRVVDAARVTIKGGRKTHRDNAVKKLTYLKSAQKLGMHPKDWMIDRVPSLPPAFRPVSLMQQSKTPLVADANYLYKELLDARENYKSMEGKVGDLGEERLAIYNSLKAVTGLGDPIHQENRERDVKGILKNVFGSSPKYGMVQKKLLGSAVDMVGRAVILPNPDLDMDQAGIPEEKAWDVYKPFIVRSLVRKGMPVTHAMRQVQDRTKPAKDAMLVEMEERPVILSRAPVLHRYGVMAFRPKLVKGHALQLPPMVYSGFGADNDGDCCRGTEICTLTFPAEILDIVRRSIPNQGGRSMLLNFETLPVLSEGQISVQLPIEDFPRIANSIRVTTKGTVIYDVPKGVQVLSYDAKNGRSGFFPVTEFSIHPNCSGVEVTTRKDRKVGVSDDHSLYIYDQATGAMIRQSPAASIGKAVPVIKRVNHRESFPAVGIPGNLLKRKQPAGGQMPSKLPAMCIETTNEFGWWLGACVADAWSNFPDHGSICYAKTTPELIHAFAAGCQLAIPGIEAQGTRVTRHVDEEMQLNADSSKTIFNSTALANLFCQWISWQGRGAHNKRLPVFFASLPTECLYGLFAGLLDGDGSVAINRNQKRKNKQLVCHYTTVSENLVDDLQLLGKLIGVRTTVTPYKGKDAFAVSFSTVDLWRIREEIRLINPVKAAAWAEMPEPAKDDHDLVPISFRSPIS
jgi:DNA-directed RNA polymerase subunit beta